VAGCILSRGQKLSPHKNRSGGFQEIRAQGSSGAAFGMSGSWVESGTAVLSPDSGEIIVGSETVGDPVKIRYAWANDPTVAIFNTAGLPAAPFQKSLSGTRDSGEMD
jgi:hypothetical protein